MNKEQKNAVISQYNELIEEISKSGYRNEIIDITYKGTFEAVTLLGDDRVDVFHVCSNKNNEFNLLTWLFISDPFQDNNGNVNFTIKLIFELYNIQDISKPIAKKIFLNKELLERPNEKAKYFGTKGDKIFNNAGGRFLLIGNQFDDNNIDISLKEFATRNLDA